MLRHTRLALSLAALLATWSPWIAGSASAAGADLSVSGFTCDVPATLGYLDGEVVTTRCTVPVTTTGLPGFSGARIELESVTVSLDALTGFITVTRHETKVVDTWLVFGTETFERVVTLNGTDKLTDEGLGPWLATQYSLGRKLRLSVKLDALDAVAETDETNNSQRLAPATQGFYLTPLTGKLRFGPVVTTLTTGKVKRTGVGCCAVGALELASGSTLSWSPGAPFATSVVVTAAPLVVTQFSATASGLELSSITPVAFPAITGTFGGLAGEVDVTLGERGITVDRMTLTLPDGHSHHAAGALGRPLPRGESTVTLTGRVKRAGRLDTLVGELSGGFLHARELPFSLTLEKLSATTRSVGGTFLGTHYVHDVGFVPGDPRSAVLGLPRVVSNDLRYGRDPLVVARRTFRLDRAGLTATVPLGGGLGSAHFPRMQMAWPEYSLSVLKGSLRDRQTVAADLLVRLEQSPDCAECPTSDSGTVYAAAPTTRMGLGSDGAVVAPLASLPTPSWGPETADGRVFGRAGEPGTGTLFIPGFIARGTIHVERGPAPLPAVVPGLPAATTHGLSVPESLLGARAAVLEAGVLKPSIHYPMHDSEAVRGNHLSAGITVGPELYSQTSNQAPRRGYGQDLTGSTTDVHFGGPATDGGCGGPCAVTANAGTRYVVRPAGVTGVFNSDTPPSPTVYGYTLPFTRFAFRQVMNEVDPHTWNDGAISVEDPGGFDVAFTSMELACTGALGDAVVIPADPDDPTAPNSSEVLHAWQTPMTPLSLAFVPTDAGEEQCLPGERELEVGASVELAALDLPVGVTATWLPDGSPRDPRVTGQSDNVLERQRDASGKGFPVALRRTVEMPTCSEDHGVFLFNMDFGVSFFDMLNADVIARNTSPTEGEESVVRAGDGTGAPVAADYCPTDTKCEGGVCSVTAQYTWGATGYELALPVRFDTSNAGGRGLQFSGITVEHGVAVMEVNAGVEYATQDGARVTFGASANFAELEASQLALSFEIGDLASLAGVDAFLEQYGVPLVGGEGPFGAMLGDISAEVDAMLELVGDATEAKVRAEIEGAIDDAAELVAPRIFDDTAELLLAVRGLDGLVASAVTSVFDDTIEALVVPFTDSLDTDLASLYTTLVALMDSLDPIPCQAAGLEGQCAEGLRQVDALLEAIAQAEQELVATVDAVTGKIEEVRTTVRGIVTEAHDDVSALLVLLRLIREDLLEGELGSFTTPDAEVNPLMIFLVAGAAAGIGDAVTEVEGLDFVAQVERLSPILDALPTGGSSSISGLAGEIEGDLVERAVDLYERFDTTIPSFVIGLEAVDLTDILEGAIVLLTEAEATLADVELALDEVEAAIDPALAALEDAVTELRSEVDKVENIALRIKAAIECAQTEDCVGDFSGLAEAALEAQLDLAVDGLCDGAVTGFIVQDCGAASIADCDVATIDTFVTQLPDCLREPFDVAIVDLTDAVALTLPQFDLPTFDDGAELRLTLIDLIISSGAVEHMLVEFSAHFDLLVEDITLLVDDLFAQAEALLAELAAALNDIAADVLAAATSVIDALTPELPISAASIDGYALITGDELERLHVGAGFTMTGNQSDDTRSFEAALDVTSWATNGKGDACATEAEASSTLDAVISTSNLPLTIGGDEITIEDLHLGFTLRGDGSGPPVPIGLFGGITTDGELTFSSFDLYDIAFAAGVGAEETYLGASAGASFSGMSLNVGFLVGRTCNDDVLTALDPQAAEFITLPGGVFNGVYARGGASIPIIDFGCLLNLSLTADVGTWLLGGPPLTLGGLVGGGAFGKLGCIGALRGQATAFAELSGDRVKFRGEGFGVAGAGLDCDPETWTTIQKSREDKSCGTGDASLELTFDNGRWTVPKPNVSAIH